MALKVIGSGLGRTGTLSLKGALEQLGFGPCHHMVEVFMHPETMPLWTAAGSGPGDWDKIYDGYVSTVDYPGAAHWRAIADHFPDAKVLHSVRDPDKWFDSTQATIFAPGSRALSAEGPMADFFGSFTKALGGDLHDRAFMTDFFCRHTEAVKAAIPAERLLVYEVSEGWGPLCAFLDVSVPAAPFPAVNTREDFQARVAQAAANPGAEAEQLKAVAAQIAKGH